MFQFDELDETTRKFMLEEFKTEQNSGNAYYPRNLSQTGHAAFPQLMREAIERGNEMSLARALNNAQYWLPTDSRGWRVNAAAAAERLAITEFNTWYVRGLATRLMHEGEEFCQVYRAAPAYEPRQECRQYEGRSIAVRAVYDGHRARYWGPSPDPHTFSIPIGPNCHHSIRRIS